MANSVGPDQTAPIGAVCSRSRLFASIFNLSIMLGNYLQKTIFQMHFFLGALRVKHFATKAKSNNNSKEEGKYSEGKII